MSLLLFLQSVSILTWVRKMGRKGEFNEKVKKGPGKKAKKQQDPNFGFKDDEEKAKNVLQGPSRRQKKKAKKIEELKKAKIANTGSLLKAKKALNGKNAKKPQSSDEEECGCESGCGVGGGGGEEDVSEVDEND